MKFYPMTRRYFLKGLGTSLVALPFLESLVPRALAQVPPSVVTRFICLCNANGTYQPDWYPPTSNLSKMVTVGTTHKEMKLTDVAGPVANSVSHLIGPEFAPIRSKMLLLQNLNSMFPNLRGHQMATVLAGNIGRGNLPLWGTPIDPKYLGPSIDQVMAHSNKIYSSEPMVRALHLRTAILTSEPEIDLSWDYRNGQMVLPTYYDRPINAFNAIFKVSTNPPVGNKDNLLVDQVLEQFKALKNNARATASDKLILDDHMQMMYQLQTAVQNVPMTCTTTAPRTFSQNSATDRGPLLDAYIQLLVAAIKCGATRIASLTLARGVDEVNFDSVLGTNAGSGWHSLGHSAEGEASLNMRKVHQFHSQKAASLMTQLDVPEPGTGKTYLDNSIVYVGNEQANHNAHSYYNRPVLIAGSGGGMLNTNKYIDYSVSATSSRDYNRLLVTFMQAMGLAQSDYYTADMQARGIKPGFGDDRGANATDRAKPLAGLLTKG